MSQPTAGPAAPTLPRLVAHGALASWWRSGDLREIAHLPGDVVRHGEDPARAAERGVAERTGRRVVARCPRVAVSDWVGPSQAPRGRPVATVRLAYEVVAVDEPDAGTHRPCGSARSSGAVPPARAWPPGRPGPAPVRVQRVAAYAVVVDGSGRLALARHADRGPSPGAWSLPGGGVDAGEQPAHAAAREVHEETGLDVVVEELLAVDSMHFTGSAPSGRLEDFHGVRLVYRARARDVRELVVHDVGGTTAESRWVSPRDARAMLLTALARRGFDLAGGLSRRVR